MKRGYGKNTTGVNDTKKIEEEFKVAVKRIMGRIWDSRLIEDYDYRWYFSVHDETVHSFHKDHAVPVLRQLHQFMTEQFLITVPSASSIGVGRNFGDLNELGEVFNEEKIVQAVKALFNEEEACV